MSRVEIRKIIQKLKEEGKTILITSHDLSEIEKSADYVTMIENGKVVFNEDIDNIKRDNTGRVIYKRRWRL